MASVCEDMSLVVEEAWPSLDYAKVNTVVMNMFGLADTGIAKFAEQMGRELSLDYLEPGTLKMIEHAKKLSLADYSARKGTTWIPMNSGKTISGFFSIWDCLT